MSSLILPLANGEFIELDRFPKIVKPFDFSRLELVSDNADGGVPDEAR